MQSYLEKKTRRQEDKKTRRQEDKEREGKIRKGKERKVSERNGGAGREGEIERER